MSPLESELLPVWIQYCSQYQTRVFGSRSRSVSKTFAGELLDDGYDALFYMATGSVKSVRGQGPFVSQQDRSECLDILSQIDTANLCHGLPQYRTYEFLKWLFRMWKVTRFNSPLKCNFSCFLTSGFVGISRRIYKPKAYS